LTRAQVAGGRLFNPPKYDVHAPDLYIPLMGLFTYVLLSCLAMVLGDRFRPDHLRSQAYTGALAWAFACVALWGGMKAVGQAGQPWLDLVAYSGYLFVAVALQVRREEWLSTISQPW
jgi:protein transport protein YIF1